jgi:hypothetical protein
MWICGNDGCNFKYEGIVETQREMNRVHDCQKLVQCVDEAKKGAYFDGLIEGMTRFAWWKDGVQYVGTCGKTLNQAIEEAKNENASK